MYTDLGVSQTSYHDIRYFLTLILGKYRYFRYISNLLHLPFFLSVSRVRIRREGSPPLSSLLPDDYNCICRIPQWSWAPSLLWIGNLGAQEYKVVKVRNGHKAASELITCLTYRSKPKSRPFDFSWLLGLPAFCMFYVNFALLLNFWQIQLTRMRSYYKMHLIQYYVMPNSRF